MLKHKAVLAVLVVAAGVLASGGHIAGAGATAPTSAAGGVSAAGGTGEFVVFYADGVSATDAQAAITSAGGTVLDEVTALGIARVHTDDTAFVDAVTGSGAVRGIVRNHSVGTERPGMVHRFADERALEDR